MQHKVSGDIVGFFYVNHGHVALSSPHFSPDLIIVLAAPHFSHTAAQFHSLEIATLKLEIATLKALHGSATPEIGTVPPNTTSPTIQGDKLVMQFPIKLELN